VCENVNEMMVKTGLEMFTTLAISLDMENDEDECMIDAGFLLKLCCDR